MRVENKKELKSLLQSYINAYIKGIYLYTVEQDIVKQIICDSWKELGINNVVICSYDIDNGLRLLVNSTPRCEQIENALSSERIREKYKNLRDAMRYIAKLVSEDRDRFFVVIYDGISDGLEVDSSFRQEFYNSIVELSDQEFYYYIISTKSIVPDIIEKKVFYIDVPLPTSKEIEEILNDKIKDGNIGVKGESIKERIVSALNGLTFEEIKNIINYVISDGELSEEDVQYIGYMKRQLIKKSGVLDFVVTEERMEDVGGFEVLKDWMKKKKKVIDEMEKAKAFGVDMPKGILLLGMPGCGKSLCAKAISKYLGLPLLRLDMGMILGQYLGQSEENIRKAIKQSESISPCVLWIDEIEKALVGVGSGGSSSGEVTTRIFGTLLTWMQEKTKMVFIVATANKIEAIPPEFLRKGRFDEIFFVNFPKDKEREQIIKIHLRKRKKENWLNKIDIGNIVKSTEGYTGADLEALVSLIVEDCFYNGKEVPESSLITGMLSNFKPLRESMKEEIEALEKAHKKYNFVDVSK